jgi:hypothetical protein
VGAERLKKGIGFSPYAFHQRLVFHGVLASGLKLRPYALDAGQMLVAVFESGTVNQAGSYAPK